MVTQGIVLDTGGTNVRTVSAIVNFSSSGSGGHCVSNYKCDVYNKGKVVWKLVVRGTKCSLVDHRMLPQVTYLCTYICIVECPISVFNVTLFI